MNWSFVEEQLLSTANFIASDLGLCDGVLHFQYILQDSKAHVLEVTRRCSGDLYPYPVTLALGLDWADLIVSASTGRSVTAHPIRKQEGFFGRHCIMADRNGIVREYRLASEIRRNIVSEHRAIAEGQRVQNHLHQKLAVLILKFESLKEAEDKVPRLHALCSVEIEN